MNHQPSKKLSLQKETLRRLDTAELSKLDGAVGGTTPTQTPTTTGPTHNTSYSPTTTTSITVDPR